MSTSTRRDFSRRFRQALNEAGLRDKQLNELGSLFEVSAQAVRKWLNGESIPSSTRAPDIAMKLGVRRAWLLDGEMPMRSINLELKEKSASYAESDSALSISSQEYQLLNNYRQLPRSLQKAFEAILNGINSEIKTGSNKKKK